MVIEVTQKIIQNVIIKYGLDVNQDNIKILIKPSKNDSINVFVKPAWKGYKLVINNKLIELLEPDELDVVIAHESSHIYNKDDEIKTDCIFFPILFSIIILSCINFLIHFPFIYSVYCFVIFILINHSISLKVSKIIEIRADIEAVKITNKADSFIRTFGKMEEYEKHRKKLWIIKLLRRVEAYLLGIAYATTQKRMEYIKKVNFEVIPSIDKKRSKFIFTKAFKCFKGCIIPINHPPLGEKVDTLDWAIYIYHKFKC